MKKLSGWLLLLIGLACVIGSALFNNAFLIAGMMPIGMLICVIALALVVMQYL